MSNIVPFGSANLPAHLQDSQGLDKSWDDVGGGGFPRLKMKGLTLEASLNGGVVASSEPGTPISVVLLRPSKLGRTFYKGAYEEGSKDMPDCYSLDNVAPAADAKEPQCSSCDLCPMNVKGSGSVKDSKACRYRQTLGVWIPGEATDDVIFQVNLPATSIFPDEENKQGFMPLQRYVRKLKNMRLDPSKVWTEMVVDGYADPKRILLKPVGYIDNAEDYELVKKHLHSPELDRILNAGPIDGDQVAAQEFGARPAHLDPVPANKPVIPAGNQDTVNPFTGEIIYTDGPVTDEGDTYWMDESSQEVVKLTAGTNLPVEYAGIVEVGVEDYDGYMAELKAKREAEERAAREAKEKADREAAAKAAAAAPAGGGRRRGGAAASTPAPSNAEAPATTGRRRGAAATTTASTPEETAAPATTGRRRGAAAVTVTSQSGVTTQESSLTPETSTAGMSGTSRRRAAATPAPEQAATAAPAATGTGRRRGASAAAAAQAAAAAPADEQPRVAGHDLSPDMANALDAALGGDME
jgi:hypothetical protein